MGDNMFKVLLVEDTPIARKVAVIILQTLNCRIDIAEAGAKAIEMSTNNKYDLILMDIGLPDIDGFITTKSIRQREPAGNHVPIIALTAHNDDIIHDSLVEAGLDDLLMKPLTLQSARKLLEKYSHSIS